MGFYLDHAIGFHESMGFQWAELDATLREYTSIYEAGNIRYQESHCTDYDSYGDNDPIPSFFGKHDSGWGYFA